MLKKGIGREIGRPKGKLGVLIPGMGAVTSTFIAGVEAIRNYNYPPYGSLTQMGHIRLGKRTHNKNPKIKELVPLVELEDMAFFGWDIFPDSMYEVAKKNKIVPSELIEKEKDFLANIRPMPAVFDKNYVKKLDGPNVKKSKNKMDLVNQLIEDVEDIKTKYGIDRFVAVWAGSTEVYREPTKVHQTLEDFEKGLKENSADISPSQIYAYALIKMGIPYINGAPNLTLDIPAIQELAKEKNVPIAGKDFKTGQTLMKTIIAPGLKARLLGISGWFSTNILGNRDGEVLDDPESFKTKEVSKLSVLDTILQPDVYPELYKQLYHKVRINYYPPRGDNKEGWDNIDIFGWLGMPMQIKIDFLCRDSILAAPVMLDLVVFMDLARRIGARGIQEWLSFYFKSPMVAEGLYPEHDLFIQLMKLKNNLRYIMGEELITHLGVEYYD